ncbi:MAG: hypothetical protein ABR987_03235 [Terracidiphilus sp.]|jgi:hypothetical protein
MGGICIFPTSNNAIIGSPFVKVDGKLQAAPVKDPKGARRDLQPGTCAAQSALWCRNILKGVPTQNSRPMDLEAGILQTAFIKAGAAGVVGKAAKQMDALLEGTGLKCSGGYELGATDITAKVCDDPGVYLIFTIKHAIAVKTSSEAFYYFEPENGLWLFNTRPEFRRKIHANYVLEAGDQATRWMAFGLELL